MEWSNQIKISPIKYYNKINSINKFKLIINKMKVVILKIYNKIKIIIIQITKFIKIIIMFNKKNKKQIVNKI